MRVWKTFFNDVETEEAWINEMAAKGLDLVGANKIGPPPYHFVEGEPGEWIYRVEFLPAEAQKPAGRRYLEFMTEAGVETVWARGPKAVFRKRSADGPFEIHSDLDSRIAHFRRVRRWMLWMAVPTMLSLTAMATMLIEPQVDPVLTRATIAVLAIGIPGAALGVVELVRESRRIESLEVQRRLHE
jgi:hypothetical protein